MLTDESNAIPTWTGAPMTADRPVKLSELVAKRIADDIVADGLAPGARLPGEKEMLDRLQVSRGTLREALRILEVHGLLVIRSGPGGGPTVAQMTASDFSRVCSLHFRAAGITLDQLWSDRAEIETMLARLAAHNITDEHRERLHAFTQQRTEDVVGNVDKYVETASAFHQLIAEASGSPVLSLFARSLGEMTAGSINPRSTNGSTGHTSTSARRSWPATRNSPRNSRPNTCRTCGTPTGSVIPRCATTSCPTSSKPWPARDDATRAIALVPRPRRRLRPICRSD